jgi:hypothetical protein
MPAQLKNALVLLSIQVASSVILGVFLLVLLAEESGPDVGLSQTIVLAALLIDAVLVACALLITRQPWARPTIMVVQAFNVLGGVVALLNATPNAVVVAVPALGVIICLANSDVRTWLDDRYDARA